MFACKCLNILIFTENNDIQKVELDSLQLSEEHKNDAFFKKDFGRIVLNNINKEQAALVASRTAGPWIIHRCLNCSLDTHAIHKDKGASSVIIATDLLSGTSNISTLRNNENYSTAFRILINYSQIIDLSNITETDLPSNMQLAIRTLDQQASEVLRREVSETEERIKRYSEMQYTALDAFKEQANLEHNILVRLLLKHHYQPSEEFSAKMNTSSLNSQPIVSEENGLPSPKSPRQSILKPKHPLVTNLTKPKRNVSRQMSQPVNRLESLDAEGLFPLEGMDESPISTHSDVEESDTDDSASHDEGIHIPRQRAYSMSVAKSLPMNIPVFMSAYTHDVADEKLIPKAKEDSVDIAASIKALAKSVHGDAVFGDLPRPRFSTQI